MVLSTFSHYSMFHIFANMYVLHSFSNAAAQSLGTEQLLGVYLSAGVISSLASYLFKASVGGAGMSLGAVSGCWIFVIVAFVLSVTVSVRRDNGCPCVRVFPISRHPVGYLVPTDGYIFRRIGKKRFVYRIDQLLKQVLSRPSRYLWASTCWVASCDGGSSTMPLISEAPSWECKSHQFSILAAVINLFCHSLFVRFWCYVGAQHIWPKRIYVQQYWHQLRSK